MFDLRGNEGAAICLETWEREWEKEVERERERDRENEEEQQRKPSHNRTTHIWFRLVGSDSYRFPCRKNLQLKTCLGLGVVRSSLSVSLIAKPSIQNYR